MSDKSKTNDSRREFFKRAGAGTALAASVLVASGPQDATAQEPKRSHVFFNAEESECVAAIVDTFIPKDEVGPGGVELGVVEFIDRQLAGAYGAGARKYMLGPFPRGTAEQGTQTALTPAEFYRIGLAELDAHCRANRKARAFATLDAKERDEVLHAIRNGKLELPSVPTRAFLSLIFNNTMEGYFSDPIYGGNRGNAAWKMVGFPGPFRNYAEEIGKNRDRKFVSDPRGIADLT